MLLWFTDASDAITNGPPEFPVSLSVAPSASPNTGTSHILVERVLLQIVFGEVGDVVSVNPSEFSDSKFAEAVRSYKVPDKDEPRTRLTVSGFPIMLLNMVYYTLPTKLDAPWRHSRAEIERFLLGLGLPILDEDTQPCCLFGELMSKASVNLDYVSMARLNASVFKYGMDDMCLLGGRYVGKGGTKVQCLARDAFTARDIAIRLGNMDMSPLVVLVIAYAVSTDDESLVVPKSLVVLCQDVVKRFRKQVGRWHEDLLDVGVELGLC